MHVTQEVAPELKVSAEAEPACPEEPSSPRIDIQQPLVPSGKDILEKNLNETSSRPEMWRCNGLNLFQNKLAIHQKGQYQLEN